MQDQEFERILAQKAKIKQITNVDLKSLALNDIESQTQRYQKLTKIAAKPKKDTQLAPFFSPMIKVDLSLYKRKKRKEIVNNMRKNKHLYSDAYIKQLIK